MIEDLTTLPGLEHAPWSSRYLQGLIDVPFPNLSPGTRSGVIRDERGPALLNALRPFESHRAGLIVAQQRAREEQSTQQSLRLIRRFSRGLAGASARRGRVVRYARVRPRGGDGRFGTDESGTIAGDRGAANLGPLSRP